MVKLSVDHPELAKMIRECLRQKPEERPSVHAVIDQLQVVGTFGATRIFTPAPVAQQRPPAPFAAPVPARAKRKPVWLIFTGAVVVVAVPALLLFHTVFAA